MSSTAAAADDKKPVEAGEEEKVEEQAVPTGVGTPLVQRTAAAGAGLIPVPGLKANATKGERRRAIKEAADAGAARAVAKFQSDRGASIMVDLDLLMQYGNAMSYDAFDPELIKWEMLQLTKGDGAPLVKLCLATIYFGNNFAYRSKKAVDPDFFKDVQTLVTTYDIKRRKINAETLTLARIAQSHPWLIYRLRVELQRSSVLPTCGFSTDADILYCDPALAPLSVVFKEQKVADFLEGFAEVLRKYQWKLNNSMPKDADAQTKDLDAAVDDMHKFRDLAVNAWNADKHHRNLNLNDIDSVAKELQVLGYTTGFGAVV